MGMMRLVEWLSAFAARGEILARWLMWIAILAGCRAVRLPGE
jgi:hypothetical protein